MAKVIGIIGESGSGKTTSFRNLDPKDVLYIDCDGKGLSWKGWRNQYNAENKNYINCDDAELVLKYLHAINDNPDKFQNVKVIIIDTLNALMIADEFRRMKEKGFDKWQDLAQAVYHLICYANNMRNDLTVIFTAHTQTDHDENGYMFTRIKTSGRKLDKICLESKLTTVLLARSNNGEFGFETVANNSTAKTPMGAFEEQFIPNDIVQVLKALEDY